MAKELECSQAQLVMAWVIANPDVSTALTGATKVEQLHDTVKALNVLPKLTPEVLKRIEEMFDSEPAGRTNVKTLSPYTNRRK